MSQLETVMLVLLGFAVASLIALFLGKLAWNVAYRLGARRTRKQIPANLLELQAEKDRLRAEYAMLQSRAALQSELLNARQTEQMAEVMRNRNRIGVLAEELAVRERRLAERGADLQTVREQLEVVEAELVRRTETIQSLEARWRDREESVAAAQQWLPPGEAPPPGRTTEEPVLRLDTYRPQPVAALPPAAAGLAAAQDRLSRRIRDLTRLSDQIKSQRPQNLDDKPPLHEMRSLHMPQPHASQLSPEHGIAPPAGNPEEVESHFNLRDEPWSTGLDGQAAPLAEPDAPRKTGTPVSSSVANVISLAQRLRALKKDVTR